MSEEEKEHDTFVHIFLFFHLTFVLGVRHIPEELPLLSFEPDLEDVTQSPSVRALRDRGGPSSRFMIDDAAAAPDDYLLILKMKGLEEKLPSRLTVLST